MLFNFFLNDFLKVCDISFSLIVSFLFLFLDMICCVWDVKFSRFANFDGFS